MRTRNRIATGMVGLALAGCFVPLASATAAATPSTCHSSAVKIYKVTSRHAAVLVHFGPTIQLENDGYTEATIGKTFTVTGSTTISASVTAGANVGIDIKVVRIGVEGSGTLGAAVTIGGSEAIYASMTVRPHKSGYVDAGVFRTVTDGSYTVINTICRTSHSVVHAYTPYAWGFVTSGG